MIKPRSLDTAEAASYIGMSEEFLRQARKHGLSNGHAPAPRFIRVGRRSVRYLKDELDRYLDSFPLLEHSSQASD